MKGNQGTYKGFGERRTYKPWQRANIAFKRVFGIPPLERYTSEDSAEACEVAILTFIETLYTVPNINPIKKRLISEEEFIEWFEDRYPPDYDGAELDALKMAEMYQGCQERLIWRTR